MLRVLIAGSIALLVVGCGSSSDGSSGSGGSGADTGADGSNAAGSTQTAAKKQCTPGSSLGLPECTCASGLDAHPDCDKEGNFGSCAVACGEKQSECVPGEIASCPCGPNGAVNGVHVCDQESNWGPCTGDICTRLGG